MNPIDETLARLRREGRKALIPFLTGGFPDLERSLELCLELTRRGADVIEIGIPFSDPIADGPTIQYSSQQALSSGSRTEDILKLVNEIRSRHSIPIVLMSYFNPLFHWGISDFIQVARSAGVDGLIIPDLPPEEAGEVLQAGEKVGLDLIFLLAPTSNERRIRLISNASKGYIYYVSVTGTTGARKSLAPDLEQAISRIRRFTDMPIAVGFGISTPRQACSVGLLADGVIVGSALLSFIRKNLDRADLVREMGAYFNRFKAAMT